PAGPPAAAARRFLQPLLSVGRLTESGVYYLPFGQPRDANGRGPTALHVADGSEIVSDRAGGPSLGVDVDAERYGSCLARLSTPRLGGGYLPRLPPPYA